MIKQLHPTLKKCACGFIGTKRELYKHFEQGENRGFPNEKTVNFWVKHGEVPYNIDETNL